jgi:hypothetical protein
MVLSCQEHWQTPFLFNVGYVVGYLSTLERKKRTYRLSDDAFCDGYHEGLQAYCLLGPRHVVTFMELACLFCWFADGKSNAYHAGYVAGFIQGVTKGIHAVLTLTRGAQ